MIEVFGGQQEEGGAVFARAWLAAGGAVEERDMCLESRERFEDSRDYWEAEVSRSGDDLGKRLYVFELPSSALMPRNEPTRSLENPLGNEAIPIVAAANQLTARVVAMARLLASRGAGVVVMAPLFATVWGMPAMRELLNEWGNSS